MNKMGSIVSESLSHHTNGTTSCLPKKRITLSHDQIMVGSSTFTSASAALLTYLEQYESLSRPDLAFLSGRDSPTALLLNGKRACAVRVERTETLASGDPTLSTDSLNLSSTSLLGCGKGLSLMDVSEDVENLLNSKYSSLELQEEVKATLQELKFRHLIKQSALKSDNLAQKSLLQQEVDIALLKSAQMLEKVSGDNTPSTSKYTSDPLLTSMKTEASNSLISSRIYDPDVLLQSGRTYLDSNSSLRHTASSSSHCGLPSYFKPPQTPGMKRSSSIDGSLLTSYKQLATPRNTTSPISYMANPTGDLKHARSRSISPHGSLNNFPDTSRNILPALVVSVGSTQASTTQWNSPAFAEHHSFNQSLNNSIKDQNTNNLVQNTSLFVSDPPLGLLHHGGRKCSINENNVDSCANSRVTTESQPGFSLSELGLSDIDTPSKCRHVSFQQDKPLPRHSSPILSGRATESGPSSQPLHGADHVPSDGRGGPAVISVQDSVASLTRSQHWKHMSWPSDLSLASTQTSNLDTLALLTGKMVSRPAAQPVDTPVTHLAEDYQPLTAPVDQLISALNQPFLASPLESSTVYPDDVGSSIILDMTSTDGLDGDRPWEQVTTSFKPPVAVETKQASLGQDKTQNEVEEKTLTGGRQPGSLETLKNMLFKLQAEETSYPAPDTVKGEPFSPGQMDQPKMSPEVMPALQNYDFQSQPGGQSLEKALIHLNRLKKLVQNTTRRDPDEGLVVSPTTANQPPSSL